MGAAETLPLAVSACPVAAEDSSGLLTWVSLQLSAPPLFSPYLIRASRDSGVNEADPERLKLKKTLGPRKAAGILVFPGKTSEEGLISGGLSLQQLEVGLWFPARD